MNAVRKFETWRAGGMPRRVFLKMAGAGVWWAGCSGAVEPRAAHGTGDADAGYRLPDWFESQRGQIHTRLMVSGRLANMEYPGWKVGEAFRSMGALVYTRHVKSGELGPLWPTRIGTPHPMARERNFAAEMIEDAHRAGCRMISYYWITAEKTVAMEHPDWLCRDREGGMCEGKQGTLLCLNSPYRDFLQQRLLELVAMGTDGIYFDYKHMPETGCYCTHCRERFLRTTGTTLSAPAQGGPPPPALIAMNNAIVEDAFRQWRAAIHARNPECVMVVSSGGQSDLYSAHLSTRMFGIMDSNKTEYAHPYMSDQVFLMKAGGGIRMPEADVKMAMGWSLCRDGADGRPAHVWIPGTWEEAKCRLAAAGMVAHGCVANIDVNEKNIPDMRLKPAFDLCARASPALAGTRPLRWAAVHFSEAGRPPDAVSKSPGDKARIWTQSSARSFGAYRALLRDRLPVCVINDTQLEQGRTDGYSVLFLPNPEALNDRMRASVRAFQDRGGRVVEHRPEWEWHTGEGIGPATEAFRAAIADIAGESPVRGMGGPEKMHVVPYLGEEGRRIVVAICNDFSWVDPFAKGGSGKRGLKFSKPADGWGPVRDAVLLLQGPAARGDFYEALTGRKLAAEPHGGGVRLALPEFDALCVVVGGSSIPKLQSTK